MTGWQAIIFDLDDTLYPERAYVLSGFRAVSVWLETELDRPAHQTFGELLALFDRGVRGDTFDSWLKAHGLDTSLVPALVQVYRNHEPVLDPFPEIPGLLAALHSSSRLGIVSDGYLAVQRRKLAALQLAHHFDAVVFSDKWGREAWKPSTRPFLAVLAQLEVGPSRAVYIADNPAKDFLGPRQIGMTAVWLRQPGGLYAHLHPPTDQHAPHLCVESMIELKQTLLPAQAGQ